MAGAEARNWVVPSSQGGYVGNEKLFDVLGVLPSQYRVNLETIVRRQYEDANVDDGWMGIAFIETCVKSGKKKGGWTAMPKKV